MKGEGTDVGTTFRSGSSYTIEELADLARQGMEAAGLTQSEVAGVLNERYKEEAGRRYTQPQISAALKDPARYPGTILRMIAALTGYEVDEAPLYTIRRK